MNRRRQCRPVECIINGCVGSACRVRVADESELLQGGAGWASERCVERDDSWLLLRRRRSACVKVKRVTLRAARRPPPPVCCCCFPAPAAHGLVLQSPFRSSITAITPLRQSAAVQPVTGTSSPRRDQLGR